MLQSPPVGTPLFVRIDAAAEVKAKADLDQVQSEQKALAAKAG
jgi:hypothetical protein